MKTTKIIISITIILSFAAACYLYFFDLGLPEKMASHWNAQGEVDGYMPKFWALFLMPFISVGVFLLFLLVPKIDPLKKNIEKFRAYFDFFILLIVLFLFYLYLLTVFWNFGLRFNMGRAMAPALGLLFIYCGVLIKKAKRNWFVGIRTPWTLSSDVVWDKTHKLGGKLFQLAGIVAFLGIIFPDYLLWLVLVPALAASVFVFVYSYFLYQKKGKAA